jgi:putative two-component system response regulator
VRVRHPDTAVVLVTAVADVDVAVSCLAIGAMDYLTKPFHLEEVRARVAQALDKRRLVIENRDYRAQLEERVAAQARRLSSSSSGSVQALAEALEVKDAYTRGHSVRVGRYCGRVARQLGPPRDVCGRSSSAGRCTTSARSACARPCSTSRARSPRTSTSTS